MKQNQLISTLGLLVCTAACAMADDATSQRIRELDLKIAALKSERAGILAKNPAPVPQEAGGILDAQGQVGPRISNAVLYIKGDQSAGTGFVGSSGGKTYVYTTAGVLMGNTRLVIQNSAGVSFKKFGNLEAAENVDAVRMEITEEVKDFLDFYPGQPPLRINQKIAAIGAGGENAAVTVRNGLVLGTSAETLEVDAENNKDNNGGPILDVATGKVVGLASYMSDEQDSVWSEGTRQGQARRFACRLDRDLKWKTMKIGQFLADGKALLDYQTETLVCGLVGRRVRFGITGEETELYLKNREHPLVKAYSEMNLGGGGPRGTAATAEIQKKRQSMLAMAYTRAVRSKDSLKPETYAWFHRVRAKKSIEWREKCIEMLGR
ncbi:hypothetical protein JIN84_07475 [Luteolibacter yonseiensis]|uniref:Curli production assembly/transport component CsgG n=1 Tax=Luteolibacter yonseiensis TaxID=1144680 RepID=A0A934QZ91_9BACT|nr:hypothetical protein [Luteolibacter yonseiensis]MBK1815448.1 hypothetical protein [Luteolibacter yonseiensis]